MASTDSNSDPVSRAVLDNDLLVLTGLLQRGCASNVRDQGGRTPLHHAVANGKLTCLEMLLTAKDCDVNCQDMEGDTPLLLATRSWGGDRIEMMVLLLNHDNIDVNKANNSGAIALRYAAISDLKAANLLLHKGSNVNKADLSGDTPLHYACRMAASENSAKRMCNLLISHGARLDAFNNNELTPIHVAADHSNHALAMHLLQVLVDQSGNIPSFLAGVLVCAIPTVRKNCFHHPKRFEFIKMLLDLGAEPDKSWRYCDSALSALCSSRHKNAPELIELMLPVAKSADVSGPTLVQIACKHNHKCLETLLRFNGKSKLIKSGLTRATDGDPSRHLPPGYAPFHWEYIDDFALLLNSYCIRDEELFLQVLTTMRAQGWPVHTGGENNLSEGTIMPTLGALAFSKEMNKRKELAAKCIRVFLEHGAHLHYRTDGFYYDSLHIVLNTWPFFLVKLIQLGAIPPEILTDNFLLIYHRPQYFILVCLIFGYQGGVKSHIDNWYRFYTHGRKNLWDFKNALMKEVKCGNLMTQSRTVIRRRLLANNIRSKEGMERALHQLLHPPLVQYVAGFTDLPNNIVRLIEDFEKQFKDARLARVREV